jgi:hypothetical protein
MTATTFTFKEPNGGTMHIANGQLHRDGAPAIDRADEQEWYVNGKLHREDGPARLIRKNLCAEWWIAGKCEYSGYLIESVFNEHWHKEEPI